MAHRFARARGFAEVPSNSALAKLGPINWLQAPSFVQDADAKLQLGGQLVAFYNEHGIAFEPTPPMSEQEWNAFLDRTRTTEVWQAFSEKTSSGFRYTLLVEYKEVNFSRADLLKARVVENVTGTGHNTAPGAAKKWWEFWKR